MKKVLKNILEYALVFAILLSFCFFINKDIVMKALYKDDLFHWSWFRGLNFFDFAIKFYESSKYRPVFESFQYLFYIITDTDPMRIITINKVYNSIIALFIYHFIKRLDVKRVIAFALSILYLVSHFSYYQIGQGIGSLESGALFFSLIILFCCLRLSDVIIDRGSDGNIIKPDNAFLIRNIVYIFIMYLVVVFTHERFMGLAAPIFIAIILSKDDDKITLNKRKIISIIVFLIEISIICYIRYIALGKVMPAGTGGTNVEETFSLMTCLNYCFQQVAFILGINIGPEHLVGIDFFNLSRRIKILACASIALIIVVVITYLVVRIKNFLAKKNDRYRNYDDRNFLAGDLVFLSFIAMCIGASSVTIRIEMRFVYASFTAAIIYLSYMYSVIYSFLKNIVFKYILTIIVLFIVILRIPVELTYRSYYDRIYCFVDMKRVNSVYDLTIGKYGLDDIIHNKKIYLINQFYDMSDFYGEYILKIYDKNNVGNKIIVVDSFEKIPKEDIGDNTIILCEDLENMCYKQLSYE